MARKVRDASFAVSVEPVEGGASLLDGTFGNIGNARAFVETLWKSGIGSPIRTIALIQYKRVFDCFDGRWSSDYGFDD